MKLKIECEACTGHGMGSYGPESRCTKCKGRGFFEIDTANPDWIEYCEAENLDVETGEELED